MSYSQELAEALRDIDRLESENRRLNLLLDDIKEGLGHRLALVREIIADDTASTFSDIPRETELL